MLCLLTDYITVLSQNRRGWLISKRVICSFVTSLWFVGRQGSVFGIVYRLRAAPSGVRIPAGSRYYCFLKNVQSSSGAHSVGLFLGKRRPGHIFVFSKSSSPAVGPIQWVFSWGKGARGTFLFSQKRPVQLWGPLNGSFPGEKAAGARG